MFFSQNLSEIAFLRFHLKVGARLAAKTLAPLMASFFGALYLFKFEFFVTISQAVFIDAPFIFSALLYSCLAIWIAHLLAPKICHGLNGWIRHLPLKGRRSRQMAVLSLFIALFPLLAVLAVPIVLLAQNQMINPSVLLLGLPVLGLSSALLVIPAENAHVVKILAFGASVLSVSGRWPSLALAIALFCAAEAVAGSVIPARSLGPLSKISHRMSVRAAVAWRALRWRIGLVYLPALAVFGGIWIFTYHNDLTSRLVSRINLFGGGAGAVFICALLSHILAIRRPPWAWSRSLPSSSFRRILGDSLLLALSTVPFLSLMAMADISTLGPLLLCLPALCLFSVWTMNRSYTLRTGAYGTTILYGFLSAISVCLFPPLAFLFLFSVPLLCHQAAASDRKLKVSRWSERHHLAVGDTFSWSR